MDREIPKEVKQKEQRKTILKVSLAGIALIALVSIGISLMQDSVDIEDLV